MGISVRSQVAGLCGVGLVLMLSGCKAGVAGECQHDPGHLCITVESPQPLALPINYDIQVLVGPDCGQLLPPDTRLPNTPTCPPPPPAGLNCQTSENLPYPPVPSRYATAGEFTADVDLSKDPQAGQVRVALVNANNICLAAAVASFTAGQSDLTVMPTAAGCSSWHLHCDTQVDCGGPARAQICCNNACIDPPDRSALDLVFIPAGSFTLGSTQSLLAEEQPCPGRITTITQPFYIDRYEATVAQYQQFMGNYGPCQADPMSCMPLQNANTLPQCTFVSETSTTDQTLSMNCVTHEQAAAYCAYHNDGELLPTEAQWEWAASADVTATGAPCKRVFPFLGCEEPAQDNTITCTQANGELSQTANGLTDCVMTTPNVLAADSLPAGERTAGSGAQWPSAPIANLSGNVAEWVADKAPDVWGTVNGQPYYCGLSATDPLMEGTLPDWVVRGGGWDKPVAGLHTYSRDKVPDQFQDQYFTDVGIRCIQTLQF